MDQKRAVSSKKRQHGEHSSAALTAMWQQVQGTEQQRTAPGCQTTAVQSASGGGGSSCAHTSAMGVLSQTNECFPFFMTLSYDSKVRQSTDGCSGEGRLKVVGPHSANGSVRNKLTKNLNARTERRVQDGTQRNFVLQQTASTLSVWCRFSTHRGAAPRLSASRSPTGSDRCARRGQGHPPQRLRTPWVPHTPNWTEGTGEEGGDGTQSPGLPRLHPHLAALPGIAPVRTARAENAARGRAVSLCHRPQPRSAPRTAQPHRPPPREGPAAAPRPVPVCRGRRDAAGGARCQTPHGSARAAPPPW